MGGYKNFSSDETADQILDKVAEFSEVSLGFREKGEFEKAVQAMDQAYALILDVNTGDDPHLIQRKKDLRLTISKRILELYASRNIAVSGKFNAIPLVMNKYVQTEIDFLMKTYKNNEGFFINAYRRSGMYRPYMVTALKKAGLPEELSWLPLIESGFKVKALSPARALGLWQFIPSTGVRFGLKRDKLIDERLDPEKSTRAAIAYLKELHAIFGDWTTVLAAYNCGEGRVLRVIRSQNANYLDNFWDIYERLPRETARYVPRFLATLHIVRNMEKYGVDSIPTSSPLKYETLTISKQTHLKEIAKIIGVSPKILKTLNPELRRNILPGKKYSLRIPPDKKEILMAKLDDIPVFSIPKFKYHRVKRGETLSRIAKRYHASVKSIRLANKINKRGRIVAGKTLKIPVRGAAAYISKKAGKVKHSRTSRHVVKKGDSLWNIAGRYGTTAKKICKLNKLPNTKLHIGQVLKVPGRGNKNKKH